MGQKHEIFAGHIISFEMEVKLTYKNCSITVKKNDTVYTINSVIISEKGYIVENSQTFVAQNRIYPKIIDYLNNIIHCDLETVYRKLIYKKGFINNIEES